jgi:hypothetical protein
MTMTRQEWETLGMTEVKEATLVKFDKPGVTVEGVLRAIDVIEVNDPDTKLKNRCTRYTVEEEPGVEVVFLGMTDLDRQIKPSMVNRVLYVKYEGTDQNIVRNGNAMKRFKVAYSAKTVNQAA